MPKWPKIGENPGDNACNTLKNAVFAGNANRSLEDTGENRQYWHNTTLLGEYRKILPAKSQNHCVIRIQEHCWPQL